MIAATASLPETQLTRNVDALPLPIRCTGD